MDTVRGRRRGKAAGVIVGVATAGLLLLSIQSSAQALAPRVTLLDGSTSSGATPVPIPSPSPTAFPFPSPSNKSFPFPTPRSQGFVFPSPSPMAFPFPSPSPTLIPGPVATATSAKYEGVPGQFQKVGDSAAAALKVLIALIALALLMWALRQRSKRQVVVGDLVNASGSEMVGKMGSGLSQRFRETLIKEIERLRKISDAELQEEVRLKDRWRIIGKRMARRTPLPRPALDDKLSQMAATLKDLPGGAGPLAQLAALAWFRPGGTRVTPYLFQTDDHERARLQLSFDLSDLRNELEPLAFTIPDRPGPTTDRSLGTQYESLFQWAARYVAIELYRREGLL